MDRLCPLTCVATETQVEESLEWDCSPASVKGRSVKYAPLWGETACPFESPLCGPLHPVSQDTLYCLCLSLTPWVFVLLPQDLGMDYYVIGESFETSVPWDR